MTVSDFFMLLHVKYHSKKDAKAEIMRRVNLVGFDLHVHTIRHMQHCTTNTIALSFRKDVTREGQAKLYWMNKQSTAKKEAFPHAKNWIFVPFQSNSCITEVHITSMIREQNYFL
eukprot:8163145-Ditylum_brightwellii.AAC.1